MILFNKFEDNNDICQQNKYLDFVIKLETYFFCIAIGYTFLIAVKWKYYRKIHKSITLNFTNVNLITNWNQVDRMCCICLENLLDDDIVSNIPCGHYDHLVCISEWAIISNYCPRCKNIIN